MKILRYFIFTLNELTIITLILYQEYQTELGKVGQRRQNIQVHADLAAQNRKWDMEREIQALQVTALTRTLYKANRPVKI